MRNSSVPTISNISASVPSSASTLVPTPSSVTVMSATLIAAVTSASSAIPVTAWVTATVGARFTSSPFAVTVRYW